MNYKEISLEAERSYRLKFVPYKKGKCYNYTIKGEALIGAFKFINKS